MGLRDDRSAPTFWGFWLRLIVTPGVWRVMVPWWKFPRPRNGVLFVEPLAAVSGAAPVTTTKPGKTVRLYAEFRDLRKGKRYSLEIGRWYRPIWMVRPIQLNQRQTPNPSTPGIHPKAGQNQ